MNSKPITIKQLAADLKMSSTTVSRVLNGHAEKYRISKGTVELVKKHAEKHRFQPNQIAQNLRLQKTNTIGLVVPDISNPFFANLARVLSKELRIKNKLILLGDTQDNIDLEIETLQLLAGRKVDGILITPVGLSSQHFEQFQHIPTVFIDRYFAVSDIPFSAVNNQLAAYQATSYLLKNNHKSIACIQGLTNSITNQERVSGFQSAVKDFIEDIKTTIIGKDFGLENGYESIKTLLDQDILPTAILTFSNQIAIGAMKAIKEAGLIIPHDISLISFDEQPYFQLTAPPITTIQQPIAAIAKQAVQMLMGLIDGKQVENCIMKPKLIIRESVRRL